MWYNTGYPDGWYKKAVIVFGTTLDPAFVSPDASLSSGNLKVSSTSGTNNTERSIANHNNGSYYCEFTIGQASNSGYGICTASQPGTNYVGQTSDAFGWYGSWLGGSGAAGGPALVAGHTYAIATSIISGSGICNLWLKDITAAGNWNGSGTADPASGLGAQLTAFTAGTAVYIAITCSASGDNTTFNFGGSAYAGSVPSGFINW